MDSFSNTTNESIRGGCMGRYKLGQKVAIIAPFGDGETLYEITAVQGVNSEGEISDINVVTHQYEVNGAFYAEGFLEA